MNNIKPKNPLLWIKYLILERRWDKVLRNSGYQHWEQYFRANDPDYRPAGRTVKDQLHGYPYIAVVDQRHLDSHIDATWGELWNATTVKEWCDRNCQGKYRWHWERVIQDYAGHYQPNGIGGTDEVFFAFKLEQDYVMFMLRWG